MTDEKELAREALTWLLCLPVAEVRKVFHESFGPGEQAALRAALGAVGEAPSSGVGTGFDSRDGASGATRPVEAISMELPPAAALGATAAQTEFHMRRAFDAGYMAADQTDDTVARIWERAAEAFADWLPSLPVALSEEWRSLSTGELRNMLFRLKSDSPLTISKLEEAVKEEINKRYREENEK